jgi:hypothetical protein
MERMAGRFLLRFHGTAKTELKDAMATSGEGTPARATGHAATERSYLYDLGEQGVILSLGYDTGMNSRSG